MASSPMERFIEAQRVYRDAFENRRIDLKEATSQSEVLRVLRNIENAELVYLKAGRTVLEKNGAAIEQAYRAAKKANDEVEEARKSAQELAERIRKVSSAIKSVNRLVKIGSE